MADVISERFRNYVPLKNSRNITRKASVLIPLVYQADGQLSVMLTLRSANLSSHAGEVSLPGGKADPIDSDEIATALREANEEVGLEAHHLQVLGTIDQFVSKHFLLVTPVVAFVTEPLFQAVVNPNEVQALFYVPLDLFLKEGPEHVATNFSWNGRPSRFHSFQWDGYRIWGLTASILIQAASIAYATQPEFEVDAPGSLSMIQIANNFDDVLPPSNNL